MSRKTLVQTKQPVVDGPIFGQGTNPADLMNAQRYSHDHVNTVARDCIIAGAAGPLAAGFAVTTLGGMNLQIGPGHIMDLLGRSFEMYDAQEVEISLLPADPGLSRVDLIVALIEVDAAAEEEFRPFIRLRTQDELEEDPPVSPFPPTQLEVATEQHNRATIQVKSSAAAENPAVPELAANEVALYQISIPPGLTEVNGDIVLSLNRGLPSLIRLLNQVEALAAQFNYSQLHPRAYTASEITIGPGAPAYDGRSVQEFINDQVLPSPLILPEILTPELARHHADSGKLGSVGALDGSVPVVDIPVDRLVVFRSGAQVLSPAKFPADANARIISKSVDAGTETLSNTVNFPLGSVFETASDGGGRMTQAVDPLPLARTRPAVCGRGDRYLEIFGGYSGAGAPLIDWHTYDVLAGTLTARNFSAPPQAPLYWPDAFSCGVNSNEVLLAMGQAPGSSAHWYRLNALTGVLTPVVGGPAGIRFTGDLIAPDLVFLISTDTFSGPTTAAEHSYWKYVPSTGVFTQLNPTGTLPVFPNAEQWTGGFYDTGKFLLLALDSATFSGRKGVTYIYDSATNQFVKPPIPGPYADVPGDHGFGFVGAVMFPLGGRLVLVGSDSTSLTPLAYEIASAISPAWRALPTAGLNYRHQPGGGAVRASTMAGSHAAMAGGRDAGGSPSAAIFKLEMGGLLETQFDGSPAVTLAPSATYSVFTVADLLAGWEIGAAVASLTGSLPAGSIKIEYSVDDGVIWTVVPPGTNTALAGPSTSRKLRITLYKSGSGNPVLRSLSEILHQAGGASFGTTQLVLRFDAPVSDQDMEASTWLRIDASGAVTFDSAPGPSTSDSAVLTRITPVELSEVAPLVKDYRNKRYSRQLKRGTRASGATPAIVWDFAAVPQFLSAIKVLADGSLKDLMNATAFPDPIAFDTDIAVGGIGSDGDGYRVDIET